MTECSPLTELDAGSGVRAVTFSTNCEYVVSGGDKGVQVWRVEDGRRMATREVGNVTCLAVSKDGRWIAAGTWRGHVIVWDATTCEQAFTLSKDVFGINGIDFSPDSARLVTASSNRTATVWDVATRDRIATVTDDSVRVWDGSSDGRSLVDIPITATPLYDTSLLWLDKHLFVVSNSKIMRFDAHTGSPVSDWPASNTRHLSCIALPQHGKFIAYSTKRTVTFWDTSTHTQLGLIQHSGDIRSIAFSPDDRFVAVGGEGGRISIKSLSRITGSIPLSRLHPTLQEPDFQIGDAALESWKCDQLADADALLTTAIRESPNPTHHVLASRALVRARLQQCNAALDDAEMAINVQPSIISYVAKSIALVGNGERHKGYRACDIAFERFHSSHVTFILLIKAIIVFIAGEHVDAICRIDDLIATAPFNPIYYGVQTYMYLFLGNSQMESNNYEDAIQSFQRARAQLHHHTGASPLVISLIFGWKFDNLDIMVRQRLCEALYAVGRTKDAGESLLKMVNTFNGEVYMSGPIAEWISDFAHHCLSAPESDGDATLNAVQHNEVTMLRDTMGPLTSIPLLRVWATASLARGSWRDALVTAASFVVPRFTIHKVICEHLETIDHIIDASECSSQMMDELAEIHQANPQDEQLKWVLDFQRRCAKKLESNGDAAMSTERHDLAISCYSAALALGLDVPQNLFIKRSKAYIASSLWEAALNDANEVIKLDPSSPWGYERKHAALHEAGDYKNAINAFEEMLLRMSQSPNPNIRAHHRQYVTPGDTTSAIQRAVQDAIRDSPRVLINTFSGRLLPKSEQAAAFASLPVFNKLISSMTTHIDRARIEQDVTQYYRYAMFSHRWEDNEPLFEKVMRIAVHHLEESLTHDKLRMFCKIVRDAGLHWAWSDTCCISKADHFALQEALVAMFKWYQSSAVTIIFLRGVGSRSQRGALMRSIWNTRAWTFQEYHASKVVRFYTEDWVLYMNLDIPNHKESPEIISEMEEATGIPARALMALRPGLNNIREKLCLASTRETTLVEDAAYSLLGILSTSLPVVYGEGDQALGRLLAQLLTSSGDTSILAWTGKSGSFNSCLPGNITVFNQLPTSHIPLPVTSDEMQTTTARMHTSSILALVMKLYDRLHELPVPSFLGQRMKLPCLTFELERVSIRHSSGRVLHAKAGALGVVEIVATENLSRLDSLILVHPWIDFLLDRQPIGSVTERKYTDDQPSLISELSPQTSNVPLAAPRTRVGRLVAALASRWSFGRRSALPLYSASLPAPSSVSQTKKQTQALRSAARLTQPFGALLFTPTRQNIAEYRRVAAEILITVQVEEITPAVLSKLIDGVRILDVL